MGESRDERDQREDRLRALRDLAHERTGTARSLDTEAHLAASMRARGRQAARERKGRRRWLWLAGSLLILVALATGAVVQMRPGVAGTAVTHGTGTQPQPYLYVFGSRTTTDALVCPQAVAWSPDSQRFAVLGALTCDHSNPAYGSGGTLAIFDAATHRQVSIQPLDTLVKQSGLPKSVTRNAQAMSNLVLFYSGLSWSPNGQQIALTYGAGTQQPSTASSGPGDVVGDPDINGLMLLPTGTTGSPQFFLQPEPRLSHPNGSLAPYDVPAWKISTGKEETLKVGPAFVYAWTATDTLRASVPVTLATAPASVAAPGPVGNPIGGTTFTLWQQGQSAVSDANCATPATPYPSYLMLSLDTGSGIWSPDGRVFIPGGVSISGRVDGLTPQPGAYTQGECFWAGTPDRFPVIPIRDAALRAVLKQTTEVNPPSFAWSQDGKHLAVTLTQMPSVTTTSGQQSTFLYALVNIYDCATGHLLASFDSRKMEPTTSDASTQYASLSWSPDGRHLLLLDQDSNSLAQVDSSLFGK